MMQSGIYIIINNKTGRSYIGSTINFKQRWQNHKTRLRRGTHDNPYLQHSWNKYGESAFEFKVLEYLNKPKEIYLAEQFWMDVYRLEGKELYNCGLVACSPMLGRSASDETKQKIGMVSAKAYPALINIKTGEKIPAGINLSALNREYGFCKNGLYNMLSGGVLQYRGWIEDKPGAISKFMTTRKKVCQQLSNIRAKTYPAFIHKDTGEVIPAGSNLHIMCSEQGLDQSGMWRVARGKQVEYKGWIIFIYKTDYQGGEKCRSLA